MARAGDKKKRSVYRDQYRYVLLKIHSKDLDPVEVTKALRIEPTWSSRRGIWTAPSGATRKVTEGSWSIASRLRRNCTLERHIRDVWDQVSERKAALKRILKGARADLHISVQPHRDVANWNHVFSASVLREFVDLGIGIWFSFYDPNIWDHSAEPKPDGRTAAQTKGLPK